MTFVTVLLIEAFVVLSLVLSIGANTETKQVPPTRNSDRMILRRRNMTGLTAALTRRKSTSSPQRLARMRPNMTSFFEACADGHKEVVRALLAEAGNEIDPAKMDQISGQTVFHLACSGGHISVVHQLVNKFGSEVCNHLVNRDGKTALEAAVESGVHALVRDILSTVTRKQAR